MKKSLIIISTILCSGAAFATVELTNGYNTWSTTSGLQDNDNVDIAFNSAGGGLYIDADGKTITSATIPATVNFIQVKTGYTATVSSTTAVKAGSKLTIGTVTEASKPNFLGTLNMAYNDNKLNFEVNSGTLNILGSGGTFSQSITVNSQSVFNYRNATNTAYQTLNNPNTITINGGELNAGRIVVQRVLLNSGSLKATNGMRILSTGNTINGNFVVSGCDASGESVVGDDGVTYYTRRFSLRLGNGCNATIVNDGKNTYNIGDNATILQTCVSSNIVNDFLGKVTVSAAASALKFQNNIVLSGYGQLTLNSTNAFATVNGSGVKTADQDGTTFYISRKYNDAAITSGDWVSDTALNVNANNDLGALSFGSNTKLTLNIANDAVFSLGSITTQAGSNGEYTFVIDNWHDNSFRIVGMDLAGLEALKFYDTSLDQLEVYFVETSAGSGEYWVNSTIPEPAEWAMILGALALAVAAYRRRR